MDSVTDCGIDTSNVPANLAHHLVRVQRALGDGFVVRMHVGTHFRRFVCFGIADPLQAGNTTFCDCLG